MHPEQRLAYIPKVIVEALGTQLKAKPNQYAALIYSKDADPALVIKSVELLLEELKLGRLHSE